MFLLIATIHFFLFSYVKKLQCRKKLEEINIHHFVEKGFLLP